MGAGVAFGVEGLMEVTLVVAVPVGVPLAVAMPPVSEFVPVTVDVPDGAAVPELELFDVAVAVLVPEA